ncbi:lytic transglycosylase domain-containing protein [Egicoccus sp. AB-alg2]|uniref:lytic transglycosylase domain-containing protein n=1 Tax=Egicoccus sp. AB-alg2 TaxID=3242693 RepID=UPI00359E0201
MIATTGASGMVDVQARIAAIQGRIQAFVPAAPAVATATSDATARSASFAQALAASASYPVMSATAGAATTTPVGATPGSGTPVGATAGTPAEATTGTSGAWADRLPPAGRRWAGAIEQAATEAGVDPALLAALVKHESNFDPNVRSHAGAIGLAQLMPGTAAGLRVDPTDPLDNLRGGARYLKQQLDRFGSVDLALAAYNAGPNRVAQAGGVPRIRETQTYVQRVMNTWEQLR